MGNSPRKLVPFCEAAQHISNADLLLKRDGLAPVSWQIRLWTHSEYHHAATVYWKQVGIYSRLCVVDTIEGIGGRSGVPLCELITSCPGQYDVYAINKRRFPEYDRQKAIAWALDNIPGRKYGNLTFWHIMRTRLPFLRMFWKPDFDDLSPLGGNHICSTARAAMDRLGGGVDAVKNLADAFVTPGDLAKSHLYDYRFTLVPDLPGSGQEVRR